MGGAQTEYFKGLPKRGSAVIFVDLESVLQARALADSYPELTSRDLLHLAVCQINRITELKTFDRPLLTAFGKRKKRTIPPPGTKRPAFK